MGQLADFRDKRLGGRPSLRELAKAAEVGSPTTIADWLNGSRHPQTVERILALVEAVRALAVLAELANDPAVAALLDPEEWKRAYKADAVRRAEGTSAAVEAAQARVVLERMRPGWPLSEVTDPFALEVHRAIGSPAAGLQALPTYVPRDHDGLLAEVVARASHRSEIAVMVGGSSTGKTRSCWEALNLLRSQKERWRVWHPIHPSRPEAVLSELADIAPRTVIWLNEAQLYLTGRHGEQVAAEFRGLLRDRKREPVLVLATLWPEHWGLLTSRTDQDFHAHARELLDGHMIKVPDVFDDTDLAALACEAGHDLRLVEAAEHAREGRITQYLAGVPVLLERYEVAPPATRALIHAAMDARRLGAGPLLPLKLLEEAAPGYLTDLEWEEAGDNWLHAALAYAAAPCNGIPGILNLVRPRRAPNQRAPRPRSASSSDAGAGSPDGQHRLYRLADYLDEYGRRHYTARMPPIAFWNAVAAHAHPADLTVLGDAATKRGLYRDAAQLYKYATGHGDGDAGTSLVRHLHGLHPGDRRPAQWAATHITLKAPGDVASLLKELRRVGAHDQLAALLERDPAFHVSLDDLDAVAWLLRELRRVDDHGQIAVLADRAVAKIPHIAHNDPHTVAELVSVLRRAQAEEHIPALITLAAARVDLSDPGPVTGLLNNLMGVDADITALAARVAAHSPVDDAGDVAGLLAGLVRVRAEDQLAVLAARAVPRAPLHDPNGMAQLLEALVRFMPDSEETAMLVMWAARAVPDNPEDAQRLLAALHEAGARDQVIALAERAAAHAALDDPHAVGLLLRRLRKVGADDQFWVLAERAGTNIPLDPGDAARMLSTLRQAQAGDHVTELAQRAAMNVVLDNPSSLSRLLKELRWAGAKVKKHVTALLARDPATHVALDEPGGVAGLLHWLHEVGAKQQVVAVLGREPSRRVALDDPGGVAELLGILHELKTWKREVRSLAQDQLDALLQRDPATQVALTHPSGVGRLLHALQEEAAGDQLTVLAKRAAADLTFDAQAPNFVLKLRDVGAIEQADSLNERFIAEGRTFPVEDLIRHDQTRYRYGREPDASGAAPWTWDDL
ncbi:hypothetical protein [Streptomyces sp. NPDC007988]|uniref:hypothetical protein n=1 Tax=Streptomyces sp. NPDC007988 TaxID=3364802 RepID=UPI0036E01D3D